MSIITIDGEKANVKKMVEMEETIDLREINEEKKIMEKEIAKLQSECDKLVLVNEKIKKNYEQRIIKLQERITLLDEIITQNES